MIKHRVLVVKVFVHNAFTLRKGIAGPNIGKRLKTTRQHQANSTLLTLGTLNTGSATLVILILVHAVRSGTLLLPL